MWNARVLYLILNLILFVNSKRYDSRCKLVRDLLKNGVPNDIFLGSWVCLIEQVSNRDTSALVEKNGKKFYGLYQIPSSWCKEGKRGGDCNITCESLLDDDIKGDTECASKIFTLEGFKYWSKWEIRCKKNLDYITKEIYKCPDFASPRSSPERTMQLPLLHSSKHPSQSLARTGYKRFLIVR